MQVQDTEYKTMDNTLLNNHSDASGGVLSESVRMEGDEKDEAIESLPSVITCNFGVEKGESTIHKDDSSSRSSQNEVVEQISSNQQNGNDEVSEYPEVERDGIVIEEITEDATTTTSHVADHVEENCIVDEPEETCTTVNALDESGHIECCEVTIEDENESSYGLSGEETYPSYISNESSPSDETKNYEASETSVLTRSKELNVPESGFNGEERVEEEELTQQFSVTGSSWVGNIRSISARRPVRKGNSLGNMSNASSSCGRIEKTIYVSKEKEESSVESTERGFFYALKRKAFDNDAHNMKKQKTNDTVNSKFFSMVSSPLRLLRYKLGDRVVEAQNVHTVDISNPKNDTSNDEDSIQKFKEETMEIKDKPNVIDNWSSYQNWCNVM